MFMHILGNLVGGVALVVVILFFFSYLRYGKLGSPPWDIRLPIIRDQLITLVSIATLSNLLFAFGLYFLGKIAAGVASALTIYFVWEDVRTWAKPPLSDETKRAVSVVVLILMVLSFVHLLF